LGERLTQQGFDGLQPVALGRPVDNRQALGLFRRHPKGRVDHAERTEDAFLEEILERQPGG